MQTAMRNLNGWMVMFH